MKQEVITLRVDSDLKEEFQKICDRERTDMSNKLYQFINEEVETKKIVRSQTEELLRCLVVNDITIIHSPRVVIKNGEVVSNDSEGQVMQVESYNFNDDYTLSNFLFENINKKIFLYLDGCNLPKRIRCFTYWTNQVLLPNDK